MLKVVRFKGQSYKLIITNHAYLRMKQRQISYKNVIALIEIGKIKNKKIPNRFWIYGPITKKQSNYISLSVVIEKPNLIVVTTLINWRPE